MKTIPFIDLKAQYQALEKPIRQQIENVMPSAPAAETPAAEMPATEAPAE